MNSIEVHKLSKRFGGLTAVKEVSFTVSEGEFFGLLGPNGAGKTTLIRMLTTLLKPSSGRALVAGFDVAKKPDDVRRSIGVVPQAMTSDLDLTGFENMDIYGNFYGIPKKQRRERIRRLLDMVGLTQRAGSLVATYSGGMRRRLEIVKALVHRPRILFLDEPTLGLDPQSRRNVWNFLEDFKREDNLTIFLTTHYMEEAESLCDRVGIIDYGSIIALDSPEGLKSKLPEKDVVVFELPDVGDRIVEGLGKLDIVHNIVRKDSTLRISVDNGSRTVPPLMGEIYRLGGSVRSVVVEKQSLEDVFIHYTGRSIRDEETRKVSFLTGAGVPQKWGR